MPGGIEVAAVSVLAVSGIVKSWCPWRVLVLLYSGLIGMEGETRAVNRWCR